MWPTHSRALTTRAQSFRSRRGIGLCLGFALSLVLSGTLHGEGVDPAAARVSALYDALLQTMKQASNSGSRGATASLLQF